MKEIKNIIRTVTVAENHCGCTHTHTHTHTHGTLINQNKIINLKK